MSKITLLSGITLLSVVITLSAACTASPAAPRTILVTSPMAVPSNAQDVQISLHPDKPGLTIPEDFLGLSFDAAILADNQNYFDVNNTQFINLLQNLGNGVLSFGATGVDHTYWIKPPGVPSENVAAVLLPSDVDQLFAFSRKTGWRVILGLNLGANDPKMAADEAAYAAKAGGDSLLAFEIGNEPDIYFRDGVRTPDYTYADYQREVETYIRTLRSVLPNIPIAGPATASNFTWFSNYLTGEAGNIVLATTHTYPLNASPVVDRSDPHFASIENLLSPGLTNGTANLAKKFETAAHTNNIPLRFDETNSSYPGKDGLGDTFASALWGTDYLFNLAEHGIVGANFFGIFLCHGYSPICVSYDPIFNIIKQYHAQPVYYGMLLFHSTAKGRIVPVDINSIVNVTTHAALADDGTLRAVIINKDENQTINAQITTGMPYSKATALRLTAQSLSSQSGITFAGDSVSSDGSWAPGVQEAVQQNGAGFQIVVPAGSAVEIIFQ
jgi:hypothetical protein